MSSESSPGSGGPPRREGALRLVHAALIVAVVTLFAVASSPRVEVGDIVATRDPRLIWGIAGSAILGSLATLPVRRRRRRGAGGGR